jgi:hypothetical protein
MYAAFQTKGVDIDTFNEIIQSLVRAKFIEKSGHQVKFVE